MQPLFGDFGSPDSQVVLAGLFTFAIFNIAVS